jgi:uncharacterized protein DUF6265
MHHTRLLIVATLSLASVDAQPRTDFSGTWVAATDAPPDATVAVNPLFGQQFAIRHEGEALTIVRKIRESNTSATYTLDGREVRRRIPGSLCMADSELVETATRERERIALTVVGSIAPGTTTVSPASIRQTLRLASHDTLVVEGSTRESPSRPIGTVYRRSAESMAVAQADAPVVQASIAQLPWLAGVWVGPTGSDERWTPALSGSMMGVSRSLRNNVLTEFEFLCIVQRGGGLVYQAMPNGRSPATDFRMTRMDSKSVTFENPAHDFPKTIRYTLGADGTLEAVVGAGDRSMRFTFTRQQP